VNIQYPDDTILVMNRDNQFRQGGVVSYKVDISCIAVNVVDKRRLAMRRYPPHKPLLPDSEAQGLSHVVEYDISALDDAQSCILIVPHGLFDGPGKRGDILEFYNRFGNPAQLFKLKRKPGRICGWWAHKKVFMRRRHYPISNPCAGYTTVCVSITCYTASLFTLPCNLFRTSFCNATLLLALSVRKGLLGWTGQLTLRTRTGWLGTDRSLGKASSRSASFKSILIVYTGHGH